jgi:spoIIIJ-associated protein
MEWVETTGRTVAEALDAALDQLGVHEEDAEYEVLAEPKKGLLGFGSSDARIRVRIRPISREKPGDRRRRGKGGNRRPEGGGGQRRSRSGSRSGGGRGNGRSGGQGGGQSGSGTGGRSGDRDAGAAPDRGGRPASRGSADATDRDHERAARPVREDHVGDDDGMPVEEQAQVAADFLATLIAAMGLDAEIERDIDDDVILLDVRGSQLGLLVGPKGATLHALEELARAVVQHDSGGHGARVRLDVAGYRAKRRDALAEFTRRVAQEVLDSGEEQELEPMSSPDRKVVHDVAAEIDGIETVSEGEDPRRYVVIRPS